MSFSSDARAEIMRTSPDDRTELRVELTAAYILAGTLTYRGKGRYQVSVSSEHAAATRYFYALTRRFESLVRPQLQTVSSAQLGGKTRYRFELDEDETLIMLSSLELLDDGAFMGVRREPDPAVFASERLTLCWLRGAFLACGWVSDPEKSYNLEFTVSGEPEAQRLSQCMNAMGYHCGVSHRKSQYVAYLRDFEGVSRLLATLGAHAAYMAYENAYIMKQVTVSVNRQMNCDGSNIEKTVKASQKQIDDINALIAAGVMDGLPASLRDMAQARLQNPDANLTELGQIMSPPLGKSGVNNRLRRLSALAEDLRANGHLPPSL